MAPVQRGGRSKETAFLRDSNWMGVIMIVLYPPSRILQGLMGMEDSWANWMTRSDCSIEVTQTKCASSSVGCPGSPEPTTK